MVPLNEVISCANHNKAATPCLIRVFIAFSSHAGFLMGECDILCGKREAGITLHPKHLIHLVL